MLIGRFGRVAPQLCNPAKCELIRAYKRGYAKDARALGYERCSAYTLAESTYRQLLAALKERASSQVEANDLVAAAITYRDGCSISLLWETALRGHDGGILRTGSVRGLDGRPILPLATPPSPGHYLVYPWTTKVQQTSSCLPIAVEHPRCCCMLQRCSPVASNCLAH